VILRLGLLVTVFLAGAALMSLEMASFRLVQPEFGSDIVVWGSMISVFLGGLALGAFMGGLLADWKPRLALLGLILLAAGGWTILLPSIADPVMLMASPGGGPPLPAEWGMAASTPQVAPYEPPDMRWPALLAGGILFGIPAILMGMASPYSARLYVHELGHMGAGVGQVYGISTVGSIAGTLGTTFYLIGELTTRELILGNGALLAAIGVALVIAGMAFKAKGVAAK
jgi:hypothetical protein